MTVEQAIVERLGAAAAVTASAASRIYQLVLPQRPTLPAVRVQLVDEPLDYHLRGANALARARLQIDAVAQEASAVDPYAQANQLADAIDGALSGQKWHSADSPPTVAIEACQRVGRMPLYDAGELRLVRIVLDYIVWARGL